MSEVAMSGSEPADSRRYPDHRPRRVASIEHGTLLEEAGAKMMKERGTYLVPTKYALDYVSSEYGKLGFPQRILEKARSIQEDAEGSIRLAHRLGVKLAYGTDARVFPHGGNAKQFAYLVRWGLTRCRPSRPPTGAADLLG